MARGANSLYESLSGPLRQDRGGSVVAGLGRNCANIWANPNIRATRGHLAPVTHSRYVLINYTIDYLCKCAEAISKNELCRILTPSPQSVSIDKIEDYHMILLS